MLALLSAIGSIAGGSLSLWWIAEEVECPASLIK